MGYLDSFADPLFKTDAAGRTVFFPAGKLAKGRIVADPALVGRLRQTAKYGTLGLIVAAVVLVLVLPFWWGLAGAIGLAVLAQLHLFFQVRGLPLSGEKLSYAEISRAQAQALGFRWLIPLAVLSALLMVSSLALLIFDPQYEGWVAVAGALFFGACLLIALYQIRVRARPDAK